MKVRESKITIITGLDLDSYLDARSLMRALGFELFNKKHLSQSLSLLSLSCRSLRLTCETLGPPPVITLTTASMDYQSVKTLFLCLVT